MDGYVEERSTGLKAWKKVIEEKKKNLPAIAVGDAVTTLRAVYGKNAKTWCFYREGKESLRLVAYGTLQTESVLKLMKEFSATELKIYEGHSSGVRSTLIGHYFL